MSAPSEIPASLRLAAHPPSALPIYIDYNATTPLKEEVVAAMQPFLVGGVHTTTFGNPSSSHVFGQSAKQALEGARYAVASCIHAQHASEVVLLSGATESLNYALIGGALKQRELGRGNHIISCNIEHIATLEILKHLATEHQFEVTILPVDSSGRVSAQQITDAIRPDTILVTLMLANNEVGSVNSISEIAKAIRTTSKKNGAEIWLHTDASQAVGKHPVDVRDMDVDMLTIAGHKLYAPKGCGALYVRASSIASVGGLKKFMIGANHESDRRAGTENVILNVALGKACEIAGRDLNDTLQRFRMLRDTLESSITNNVARLKKEFRLGESAAAALKEKGEKRYDFVINGSLENRLVNTLSIGFRHLRAPVILHLLKQHLAASAGAACHSSPAGDLEHVSLSYVLQAMAVDPTIGMGTLRLSVGHYNTKEEMEKAGLLIAQVVVRLWKEQRDAQQASAEASAYVQLPAKSVH